MAVVTGEAAELLRRLTETNGPLMFHQSGGCCDGSAPTCYPGWRFRADRDRALLVGRIDEAVEALGGVLGHRQQANIVNHHQVGSQDAGDGQGDGVVGAVPAQQHSKDLPG